jgi:hypothetical protein
MSKISKKKRINHNLELDKFLLFFSRLPKSNLSLLQYTHPHRISVYLYWCVVQPQEQHIIAYLLVKHSIFCSGLQEIKCSLCASDSILSIHSCSTLFPRRSQSLISSAQNFGKFSCRFLYIYFLFGILTFMNR